MNNAGDEEGEDFFVPASHDKTYSKKECLEFQAHVAFVFSPCCGQVLHRHCILRHVKPSYFGIEDGTEDDQQEPQQRCPFCRARWYDNERSIDFVSGVANLVQAIQDKQFNTIKSKSKKGPPQDLGPPRPALLIRCLRLVFPARLASGDFWAADPICKKVLVDMEQTAQEGREPFSRRDVKLAAGYLRNVLVRSLEHSLGVWDTTMILNAVEWHPDMAEVEGVPRSLLVMAYNIAEAAVWVYIDAKRGVLSEDYEIP